MAEKVRKGKISPEEAGFVHVRSGKPGGEKLWQDPKTGVMFEEGRWARGYAGEARARPRWGKAEPVVAIPESMDPKLLVKRSQMSMEEAKALNKEMIEEMGEIFRTSETIHDAHPRIIEMLGEKAGPEAVAFLEQKVGISSWGKAGVGVMIPGKVEPLFAPVAFPVLSREQSEKFRQGMRQAAWLTRRKAFRSGAKLLDRGFLSKYMKDDAINQWFEMRRSKMLDYFKKHVIPGYQYSLGRHMDWNADEAANRLLDDIYEAPMRAAGVESKEMAGLSDEIQQLKQEKQGVREALKAGAPFGAKQAKAAAEGAPVEQAIEFESYGIRLEKRLEEIDAGIAEREGMKRQLAFAHKVEKGESQGEQKARRMLAPLLADALLMDNPAMRASALNTFKKALYEQETAEVAAKMEPTLELLVNGKWPSHMAKRGFPEDVRKVVARQGAEAERLKIAINKYHAAYDAAIRHSTDEAKDLAVTYNKMVAGYEKKKGKWVKTGKKVSEREVAGEWLSTYGKDFMHLLPQDILDFYSPDEIARIYGLAQHAHERFATMALAEQAMGIPLETLDDYVPGIYRNLDNIISDTPPSSAGAMGPGGTPNPLLKKKLGLPQATGKGLNPELDLAKMIISRQLQHNHAIFKKQLEDKIYGGALQMTDETGHGFSKAFGRRVEGAHEVGETEAIVRHMVKNEKDEWVEQAFALPKWAKKSLDETFEVLNNPDNMFWNQLRSMNTWWRGVLTSPNPGYHLRNVFSNAIMAHMGGLRDPNRYAQAVVASLAADSPAELAKMVERAKKMKGPQAAAVLENAQRKVGLSEWASKQVFTAVVDGKTISFDAAQARLWAINNGVVNKGFSSVDMYGTAVEEIEWATSTVGQKILEQIKSAGKGAAVGGIAAGPGGALAGGVIGALGSNAVIMKAGRQLGESVENNARMALFIDQLLKGVSPASAAAHVHKYLYNYRDITKVERSMREGILFYTWMRKNMPRMFEEAMTRPGRIAFGRHLQDSMKEISKDDWEGFETEYRQRYLAKMFAVPLPIRTGKEGGGAEKGQGVMMVTLDIPWRDLNMIDWPTEKNLWESLGSMTTPVFKIGWNAIAQLSRNPLKGFGRGKERIVQGVPAIAPAWMHDLPGTPASPGKEATGVKKILGIELRPDEFIKAQEGKIVLREYVPEHILWWLHQIPMIQQLSKATTETKVGEVARQLSMFAWWGGIRAHEYQPAIAKEQRIWEMKRGVQDLYERHAKTRGVERDLLTEAEISADKQVLESIEEYKARKAGKKVPQTRIFGHPSMKALKERQGREAREKALR